MRSLAGHNEAASAPLERALTLAERLQLVEVFVQALNTKAVVLLNQGRLDEARILLEAASARARTEQLYATELRTYNNLGAVLESSDRYVDVLDLVERALLVARRRGNRRMASVLRTGSLGPLFFFGRWDEALTIVAEEEPIVASDLPRGQMLIVTSIHCERGDLDAASARLAAADMLRDSDNWQLRAGFAAQEARLLRAQGRPIEALAPVERMLGALGELTITDTGMKACLVEAIEAALVVPDLHKAEELLAIPESLDPGELTPFLQANTARLRARLDAARGNLEPVEDRFRIATSLFREFGLVFHVAVTQLEHAEWLTAQQRADDAEQLLAEAGQTFEQLQATPWLERTTQAAATRAEPETAIP
jgi:tetratricopeptide (TPR) repeat protein